MRPADGTWAALPYETARPLQGGGIELRSLSLSWNGEQVVLWDRHEFSFGPVASKLSGPFPIPVLHPWLLEGATEPGYISQVLFWTSEHQLILYQFAPMEDAEPACRLFDTVTRSWQPVARCPWGSFLEVEQIDPGPGGWVAIYSAAEGSSSLLLAHYDPDSGQRQASAPEFSLYPMGSIHAQFSLDGSRVALSTPCLLHKEQDPCAGTEESERWRMYSWLIKEERLLLVREALPSHAIPAPDGERMAWHMRDRVCLSKISNPEQKKCFCIPYTSPATCTPG